MSNIEYVCPICGEEMVERQGPKIRFYGCSNFPQCKGKRTLDGTVFGVDGEAPAGLNADAEGWFNAGISDGMSYDEARDMAWDWQRMEEKDGF